MWGTMLAGMSGAGGGGSAGGMSGGPSQTSGDRDLNSGDSGITFGSYNAPASGIESWQVMLLLGVLAFMLFKAVK